jgi:hypothetical protein
MAFASTLSMYDPALSSAKSILLNPYAIIKASISPQIINFIFDFTTLRFP